MAEALHFFKALADETRLRILHILMRYELNVNELVNLLEMGQSRISRHLKILAAAGLLEARREGLWVFYTIPHETGAREFIDAIEPFLDENTQFKQDMDMARSILEERVRNTRIFFNSVAEDWDKLSRNVLGSFDLPDAVLDRMPRCEVAADLGCGTGNVIAAMREKADKVIGVDDSPRMLEMARRRFSRNDEDDEKISLRIGDLAHLPLADNEADFISLNLVLHHISNPLYILKEIYRTLKPGGCLVLTDFDRHDDDSMRQEYGDHWLGFEAPVLKNHLATAGFNIKDMQLIPVERNLSLHVILAEKAA